MKDFEWLQRQHARATGQARASGLIPETHANPKQALDAIGRKLYEIRLKQARSRELVAELWKRYKEDCKKHGVTPVVSAL